MRNDHDEWKEWFDSHKEPDGSLDLNKHPEVVECLRDFTAQFQPRKLPSEEEMKEWGEAVNYDLSSIKRAK